jgi:hypothetical protein
MKLLCPICNKSFEYFPSLSWQKDSDICDECKKIKNEKEVDK